MSKELEYICIYNGRPFKINKSKLKMVSRYPDIKIIENRKSLSHYTSENTVNRKYMAVKKIRNEKEIELFMSKTQTLTEVAFGFFNITGNVKNQ